MQSIAQAKLERRSVGQAALLLVAFLLAEGSVIYTSYHIGHTDGLEAAGSFVTEFPYTLDGLHLWISVGLGVCAISLWWSRRVAGLVISLLALVFVFGVYGFWHFRTTQYLSEFSTDKQLYNRVRGEVGFFHGAAKWDLVILALGAILFLWHIVRLTKMTLQRTKSSAKA